MNKLTNETMLVFEGSQGEFEQIMELFDSGELNNLLGIAVAEVGAITPPANLTQWLQKIFEEPDWRSPELILSTARSQKTSNSVSRCKTIAIEELPEISVVLVAEAYPENEQEISVILQVYPAENSPLPEGLKLELLDMEGTIADAIKASNDSRVIEIELSGEPGEEFSARVSLNDFSITENFST